MTRMVLGCVLLGWPFVVLFIGMAGYDGERWRWRRAAVEGGLLLVVIASILGGVGLLVGFE